MAKLPTSVDLGPAPTADATEPVANYAAGADLVGKGAQALATGINQFGQGVESFAVDQQRYQFAMAHSTLLANLTNLGEQTKNDTTWGPDASGKWLVNRHAESAWGLQDEAAKSIASGPMRERFMATTAPAIQESIARADAHATGLRNSQSIADWSNPAIVNSVVNAPDDATRRTMIDNHNVALNSLVTMGVVHPDVAQKMGQEWTQKVATTRALASINSGDTGQMTATIHELQQPPGSDASITSQIVKIEGQGRNPLSSAQGVGQFTNQTWLDTVKSARPDLAQGKTDTDILALRNDPNLAWQMTDALRKQNVSYLQSKGLPTTPGAQYLAHFLGPKGAEGVLGADPNTPVSDALVKAVGPTRAAQMIAANPTVLGGKLVGSLTQWADNKMGGAHGGSLYDVLPPEAREQIIGHLQKSIEAANVDSSRAITLAHQKAQMASDQAESTVLKDIYGDNPQVTAKDVVGNDQLTPAAKLRLVSVINRETKPETDAKISAQTSTTIFRAMRDPNSDPQAIRQMILDARSKDPGTPGSLSKADMADMLKQLEDIKTPEGAALASDRNEFIKRYAATIDPTLGETGLHSALGEQQMYKVQKELQLEENQLKKQNKDPHSLYDPKSPNFFGRPENLTKYQATLQDAAKYQAQFRAQQTATPPPAAPPPQPEQPPIEGARKAPDGNWYIQKGDKYFKVTP